MPDPTKTVLTPAGPREASRVHEVRPGQTIQRTPGGEYQLVESDVPEISSAAGERLVVAPGGLKFASHVHHVNTGRAVDGRDGRFRLLEGGREILDLGVQERRPPGRPLMPHHALPTAAPLPTYGSDWITYASWTNGTGTPVSSFATTWTVPRAPSSHSGQTVFLFNGIQNSTMIYQPVLQWGSSAAGGGDRWSVASWYADGQTGHSFYSSLVDVNEGDILVGVMTLTGQSPMGFSYNCEFQGIANTSLAIQNVEELTQCVETLEAYSITQPSDYPDTDKTAMSGIDLWTGATWPDVVWSVTDAVTDCGQHTLHFDDDSNGHGEVDLWYRTGPFWAVLGGTIGAGETQEWWFSWSGTGDVGPQLIQAQPLDESAHLATTRISESYDQTGHLTYLATVRNDGPNAVGFQWRGGGR